MLKSGTPKEGNTKDREFAAILTLKSCNILGFITHTEKDNDPKRLIRTSPPLHLELGLSALNEKQRYLIVSKADYLWLGNSYFRLCNTSLRCIRAVTLFHCLKRCCERSCANLSVQTHWRTVGSACLDVLQWCRLISVPSESEAAVHAHTRPPRPHRLHVQQRVVKKVNTQGLISHGYPVHLHINELFLPSDAPFCCFVRL